MRHWELEMCTKGAERKIRWQREEKSQEITMVAFQAYSRALETVTTFKYLGRVLTTSNNNWPSVVANFWKVLRKCAPFYRILGWEGSYPQT